MGGERSTVFVLKNIWLWWKSMEKGDVNDDEDDVAVVDLITDDVKRQVA